MNYSNIKAALIFFLLILISTVVFGQQAAYESPAGTRFLLYTPPGYSSDNSTFPLLISLHSKGEVSEDILELTVSNPEQMPCRLIYLNRWPLSLPFIVLTPQLKPDPNDAEIQWSAEYIEEVVQHVLENYRVDLDRIYLTGISRGGTGTWTYATAYPEKIAAMLPMSGRSDVTRACLVKDIPTWAFHGEADLVAPTAFSIDMINAIKACQPSGIYKPRLNLLHARNHNGWNEVYNGSNGYKIFEWLLMFRKHDTSNKRPYVNAGKDFRLQIRNEPLHIIGDFFDFDGEVSSATWSQTSGPPLTLNDTDPAFLKITNLQAGSFDFLLTVTDNNGAKSTDIVTVQITNDPIVPTVTDLVLVNGKTNVDIGNLSEGQIINKTVLGITEINIRAIAGEGTGSVLFSVNADQNVRIINAPGPFLIKTQTTGPEWRINNGEYLICATPYPQTGARGQPGVSQCFKVIITDGVAPEPEKCIGAGNMLHEIWTGIPGTLISSIPVNTPPSQTASLSSFESPADWGNSYGSRVRGYICVPLSGDYVFWISSNDRSELWLSTDGNVENKKKIAFVDGYTNVRQWTKYSTQQSAVISLAANHKYYIEALHKEGSGSDHLSVGWQLPDGTLERPMPGIRMIPYQSFANNPPVVNIASPDEGQKFSEPATIPISATASDLDGSILKVEFYNGTLKLGEDATGPYSYTWTDVPPGNYSIHAKATDNAGSFTVAAVNISVTSVSAACSATGTIKREMWTGVPGADVGSIPVNSPPSTTTELNIFEEPSNVGDNFGTRVSGYLCVPQSGPYIFWISSNDHSQLLLSSDDNPANKKIIAYVTGYTNVRQWTKYPSQQSAPVNLVEGKMYYIEALHKEGVGSDHMAVGWQMPNGIQERPISGVRLSAVPTQSIASGSQSLNISTRQSDNLILTEDTPGLDEIEIFPNPVQESISEFVISMGAENDVALASIEIITVTGEVVYRQKISAHTNGKDYIIRPVEKLIPGLYLVNFLSQGKRSSKRLLVK